MNASLALYVHLPWCVRKCPYCDFNSHQLLRALPDEGYIDLLLRDFDHELPALDGRRIDSVFFGGGTPSLFAPAAFARLLTALRTRIAFAPDAEITLEANPGTIERGKFKGYAEAGINRISLGAQSFSAQALAALGRIHSPEETLRAVEELHAAGLANFNLDLMYALPGQTLESALEDVRRACELGPTHLSYYQLTLEPGTVFFARPPALPDEELAWEMQTAGQALLAEQGFLQYEVSAYARADAASRHNLNYWTFGDYVGIGAGAHGKLSIAAPEQIVRTVKHKQPREYQARIDLPGARARIAPADLPFEFMLNALRLNAGFSLDRYAEMTGLDLSSIEPTLHATAGRGLLEQTASGWRATGLGRRFLNDLQSAFLA